MVFKIIFVVVVLVFTTNAGVFDNLQGLEKFQDANLTKHQKQNIIVSNTGSFKYFPVDYRNRNRFDFWFKGYGGAFISLSNAPFFISPTTYVVIGGWKNAARIHIDRVIKVEKKTPNILDENEYRGFWITWTQDGNISVGKTNEDFPFLVYNHTERLFPINFIGLDTYDDFITGYWIINEGGTENNTDNRKIQNTYLTDCQNPTPTYEIITNTPQFRYVPILKRNRVDFWVKVGSDAHISLSKNARLIDPKIVIIIGALENTVSTIRINDIDVIKNNTPDILDKNEYYGFWVKWSLKGDIVVGKRNEYIPFLVYKHTEQFFPINFIGVHTNNITGHWLINEELRNGTKNNMENRLDNNLQCLDKIQETDLTDLEEQTQIYEIKTNTPPFRYLLVTKTNRFEFSIKVNSDAYISLSNDGQLFDEYERIIVIGGWENTASAIRINDVDVIKNNTPDILNKTEYRSFWIEWYPTGDILVGKKNEYIPFLVYRHTQQFYPTNFVGVSCMSNYTTGHWIIYDEY